MISCRKATELISRSLEERLPLKDEMLLKMHLFLCETCELFRKQSALLRKAVRRSEAALQELDTAESAGMTESAKERIRKRLDSTPD